MTLAVELLSLRLEPDWASVDAATEAVGALAGWSPSLAERVSLTTRELVENAIKYGDWSAGGTIGVRLMPLDGGVELTVSQPAAAAPGRLEELESILGELEDGPSAERSYRERVRAIGAEGSHQGSRMGLRRIAHELGARLEARHDEDGVHVFARLTEP